MRVWVLACLMAITAMAGCVEETDQGNAGVDSCSEGSDCPDDGFMMGANPGASLAADATEGEAPTTVFFDFDVFEVPLESVTWTLDLDGDGQLETEGPGTALPGNFSFTYEAAGEFEALFAATDGTNNWTSMVAVTITEPVAEIPDPAEEPTGEPAEQTPAATGPVDQSFDGEWLVDSPRCVGGPSGEDGLSYAGMAVDALTWGQKFFVAFTGGQLTAELVWLDADGTVLLAQADTDEGEYYEITGRVPKNAAEAHFFTCATPALGTAAYTTPV